MEEGVGVTHVFHKCVTGSVFIISRISQVFIGACQYFFIWLQGEKCNLLYTWSFLRCLRYIFKSRCLIFRGVNLLVASELVKFSPRQTEGSCIGLPACISPPLPPVSVRTGRRAYADVITKFSRNDGFSISTAMGLRCSHFAYSVYSKYFFLSFNSHVFLTDLLALKCHSMIYPVHSGKVEALTLETELTGGRWLEYSCTHPQWCLLCLYCTLTRPYCFEQQ